MAQVLGDKELAGEVLWRLLQPWINGAEPDPTEAARDEAAVRACRAAVQRFAAQEIFLGGFTVFDEDEAQEHADEFLGLVEKVDGRALICWLAKLIGEGAARTIEGEGVR